MSHPTTYLQFEVGADLNQVIQATDLLSVEGPAVCAVLALRGQARLLGGLILIA